MNTTDTGAGGTGGAARDGVLRAVDVVNGRADAHERAAVTAALAVLTALGALRAQGAVNLPSFVAPWVRDRAYLVPTAWTSAPAPVPRRGWVVEVDAERLATVLAVPRAGARPGARAETGESAS